MDTALNDFYYSNISCELINCLVTMYTNMFKLVLLGYVYISLEFKEAIKHYE